MGGRRRRRHVGIAEGGGGRPLDLDGQLVVADDDVVAVVERHRRLDGRAVDLGPGVAALILDQVAPLAAHQAGVASGDVPLGEPDGVPLLTADADLLADQGYDDRFAFIILDDQFVHRTELTPNQRTLSVPTPTVKRAGAARTQKCS
jgi:hypothetical protein